VQLSIIRSRRQTMRVLDPAYRRHGRVHAVSQPRLSVDAPLDPRRVPDEDRPVLGRCGEEGLVGRNHYSRDCTKVLGEMGDHRDTLRRGGFSSGWMFAMTRHNLRSKIQQWFAIILQVDLL
jgi:hypothetical protein